MYTNKRAHQEERGKDGTKAGLLSCFFSSIAGTVLTHGVREK